MKSSIDTSWQKLVWELGISLFQKILNNRIIKEAKAICIHFTQEAKTLCSKTIKEAKATCACSTQEAETLWSMAIRDAEAQGASQADSLHQAHAKSIQHLVQQVIEEEHKSQLDFLSFCLSSHPPNQACGIPWLAGSFLPHIDGTGTDVPPI